MVTMPPTVSTNNFIPQYHWGNNSVGTTVSAPRCFQDETTVEEWHDSCCPMQTAGIDASHQGGSRARP